MCRGLISKYNIFSVFLLVLPQSTSKLLHCDYMTDGVFYLELECPMTQNRVRGETVLP